MEAKLHRAPAVADVLDVSLATLARWRARGIGPKYLRFGGTVRYREEDLREFLARAERRRTEGAAA